jgi:choline-sulfatase
MSFTRARPRVSWRAGFGLVLLAALGCGAPPRSATSANGPSEHEATSASGAAGSAHTVAPGSSIPPAEGASTAAQSGPVNVIVLLIDSMRADMPWAGYPRPIAPNLTALEKQSVSYTRGYSVSSYTAKSVAALLSGKYPSSLVRSGTFFTKYPASNLFFAELLQARGVHTLSAHAHAYLKRGTGLDQGFTAWELVKGITFDALTDNHVTSDKLTPLAIQMLEAVPRNKPFFAYVHYMDPHDRYLSHPEAPDWGKKLRDRYDQEIFFTDLWIGKLLAWCEQKPWWNETAVIVSADHGEALGEHNMHRHAFELWNVLTHVPLFVRLPHAAPRRIDTPRSQIDIAPTVLELMGAEPHHDFAGKSLVSELRGGAAEPRPVLMDLPPDSNKSERRALVHGDFKLLVLGNDWRFELFNLKEDPGEERNLAKQQPEKLAELKRVYQELWGKVGKVKPYGGNKLMGGGFANGPAE